MWQGMIFGVGTCEAGRMTNDDGDGDSDSGGGKARLSFCFSCLSRGATALLMHFGLLIHCRLLIKQALGPEVICLITDPV